MSHTLTRVAYVRRSESSKFEALWRIKMSWIPRFSLKLLSDALHWCKMMLKWWSYVLWQMNWMRNTPRQIVVAMLLHWYKQTVYRRILVFQTSREFTYFNVWFFLWLNQSFYIFKYQTQKLCDSFVCIFYVFIVQKCCVHTCIYRRFVQVCALRVWTLM